MLRVFANTVIIAMSIWALATAATAMLGATVYFPWVVPDTGGIPPHRLATIRVAVPLGCHKTTHIRNTGRKTGSLRGSRLLLRNIDRGISSLWLSRQ